MRPAPHGQAKALLLDGDPAALRRLGRSLEARGAEVLAAPEGVGGLSLLLEVLLDLDVLVVDLALPGRDAWSMLRLIRDLGGEQDLGVVVLADRPAAAVRARLRALGADAVVDRADGPDEAARAALAAAASRRARSGGSSRSSEWRLAGSRRPPLPALPALAPAPISTGR